MADVSSAFTILGWQQRGVEARLSGGINATACSIPLDPAAHPLWQSAVTAAADAFAAASAEDARGRLARYRKRKVSGALDPKVDARADPSPAFASVADAILLRTGGPGCPSSLAPLAMAGSAGFIRGLQLLSGPPQRVNWWRPHPSYFHDVVNATVLPSTLWLQHSAVRFDARAADADAAAADADAAAADVDGAVQRHEGATWVVFDVWYTNVPPAGRARQTAHAARPRGTLIKWWELPIVNRADATLHAAATRLREAAVKGGLPQPADGRAHARALDAPPSQPAGCVRRATALPVRFDSSHGGEGGEGGVGGGSSALDATARSHADAEDDAAVDAALRALASAARAAAAELDASLPPLTVTSISHWQLPPRAALPPQPAAPGVARALFVLSPVSGRGAARAADAGRLRLQLLDPRGHALRLPALSLAEWPFGFRNLCLLYTSPSPRDS